jgi:hypothetical protein
MASDKGISFMQTAQAKRIGVTVGPFVFIA